MSTTTPTTVTVTVYVPTTVTAGSSTTGVPTTVTQTTAALSGLPLFSLPLPTPMSLKGNLKQNWEFFENSWNYYCSALQLEARASPDSIVSTLYTALGRDTLQIAETLPIPDRKKASDVIEALRTYFVPQVNTVYERYTFFSQTQGDDMISSFISRLRKFASTCNFGALRDELIRDKLVLSCNDVSLRRRLLREKDLSLSQAIDLAITFEETKSQIQRIDGPVPSTSADSQVHKVRSSKPNKAKSSQAKSKSTQPRMISHCKFCGSSHRYGRQYCPANGTTCTACNKSNHFSTVCKSKRSSSYKSKRKVHSLEDTGAHSPSDYDSDDDSRVYTVGLTHPNSSYTFTAGVRIPFKGDWSTIAFQIDSGSQLNIIKYTDLARVMKVPRFQKSNVSMTCYSGDKIESLGQLELQLDVNGCREVFHFQVVENATISLLSGPACQALGLITFNNSVIVNSVRNLPSKDDFVTEFKDVFTGLGDIGTCNLELDPNAQPTQDSPHTVPVALKPELKQRLAEMSKEGMIEKIDYPTDWINSAVYVKSPHKKLRVCLDPKNLNNAIKIPKYRMTTLDDILPNLGKNVVFSVADASNGFLQIKLNDASSDLTCFHTPWGRYKWLRLAFGISASPEIFVQKVNEILEGLPGVYTIMDDTLIIGTGDTYDEAVQNHDKNFRGFMLRCREKNYKLNLSKLQFRLPSVSYHGHILSSDGLKADPSKVKAIKEMPCPKSKTDVKRFLGLVQYLSRFLPKLSEISQPLRELTKESVPFLWSSTQQTAFNTLKQLITDAPVLKYYDLNEPVSIECDSSSYGLGAVLTQNGKPVAFASRSLTETEQSYSQLEKECLALCFGTMKFDTYLRGRENIIALTDHSPLVSILSKPINKAPKRLQRMMLRLQRYHLILKYKKGSKMYISDSLSRAPLPCKTETTSGPYEIFQLRNANFLSNDIANQDPDIYHNVCDATLRKISDAISDDDTLQSLIDYIADGFPDDKMILPPELRLYWPYRDELSVHNGIIYRGVRVLIPPSLRKMMMDRIHVTHLGAETLLNRAKDSVYWPTIANDIKLMCDTCPVCLNYKPNNAKEPMQSLPIPIRRWQICSSDLFYVAKDHYLIIVDNLTKYWEIEKLNDTTSEEVIEKTKAIFSRQGICELLITDGGPCYSSKQFNSFTKAWNFDHYMSSPHHPRGNSVAEAAVKVAKALLLKSSDPYLAILEHRNTPDTSGYSSSQKLNSRKLRSLVPTNNKPKVVNVDDIIDHNVITKRRNKRYYDRNTKALPQLQVGDHIRAKLHPQSSKTWSYGEITRKQSNRSYDIVSNNRAYRRNRYHLRKSAEIHSPYQNVDIDDFELMMPSMVEATDSSSHNTQSELASHPLTSPAIPTSPPKATRRQSPAVAVQPPKPAQPSVTKAQTDVTRTRSGRVTRKPDRLGYN